MRGGCTRGLRRPSTGWWAAAERTPTRPPLGNRRVRCRGWPHNCMTTRGRARIGGGCVWRPTPPACTWPSWMHIGAWRSSTQSGSPNRTRLLTVRTNAFLFFLLVPIPTRDRFRRLQLLQLELAIAGSRALLYKCDIPLACRGGPPAHTSGSTAGGALESHRRRRRRRIAAMPSVQSLAPACTPRARRTQARAQLRTDAARSAIRDPQRAAAPY